MQDDHLLVYVAFSAQSFSVINVGRFNSCRKVPNKGGAIDQIVAPKDSRSQDAYSLTYNISRYFYRTYYIMRAKSSVVCFTMDLPNIILGQEWQAVHACQHIWSAPIASL